MDQWFDSEVLQAWIERLAELFQQYVLQPSMMVQLGVILGALVVAFLLGRPIRRRAEERAKTLEATPFSSIIMRALAVVVLPLVWLALLWCYVLVAYAAGWPLWFVRTVSSLLTAWVVIRVISEFAVQSAWSHAFALFIWAFAALTITGLQQETSELFDSMAFSVGATRVSALMIVQGVFLLVVLMWAAIAIASLVERKLQTSGSLSPSAKVLLSKMTSIVLVIIAVVAALHAVGIDLTAFAVFGGALGVGIGFGLQKVVSNLVSGVILLLDKSVKPGDVIAVAQSYGWIDHLGLRYTSVVTRDGIEHLIPNEELITTRVENWSHSNSFIRLRVPVGVSYDTDVRLAMRLCQEAMAEIDRIVDDPVPSCLLRGFGESSVDFELRFWIEDPRNGRANVTSALLLLIWDKFKEAGVTIPFPQRDLHIRSVLGRPAENGSVAMDELLGRSADAKTVDGET